MISKPHKAPGIDGISPIIIKKALSYIEKPLLGIYKAALNLNYFPTKWKVGNLVLIPKPNLGSDCAINKQYRPITLLPVFGKIYERFIIMPIYKILYSKNKIDSGQFGFTRQTSTLDALLDFQKFVYKTMINKEYVLAISLDISGAFDNACWQIIINNLNNKGCPSNLIKLVESYFTNRKTVIKYGSTCITRIPSQGCCQGSVSGPLLWNILLDSLFENLHGIERYKGKFNVQAYADDTILFFNFNKKNVAETFKIANEILKLIHTWGVNNRLEFNASKTQAIIIQGTKNTVPLLPILSMDGVNIHPQEHLKYLGVYFDKKMNFRKHVDYIIDKANKELMVLSIHTRKILGSDAEITSKLVLSVIYPKLTYASIIWFTALKNRKIIDKIRQFDHKVNRHIIRAYKSVSRVGSALLASKLPLELYIIKDAQLEITKRNGALPFIFEEEYIEDIEFLFKNQIIDRLVNQLDNMWFERKNFDRFIKYIPNFEQLNKYSATNECLYEPRVHWSLLQEFSYIAIKELLKDEEEISELNDILTRYDCICYTDGSKKDLCAGLGAGFKIDYQGVVIAEEHFPMHPKCSNYQAELMAICGALDCLLKIEDRLIITNKILICTDSQSAIDTINDKWTDNLIVIAIKNYLTKYYLRNITIHIKWVPAHTGIMGNERADYLAKLGADTNLDHYESGYFNCLPISYAKTKIKECFWNTFTKYAYYSNKPFNASPLNEWYKKYLPEPKDSEIIKKYREIISSIDYYTAQLLTGHGNFGSYLFKRKIKETFCCPFDDCVLETPDNAHHTLFECIGTKKYTDKMNRELKINFSNVKRIFFSVFGDTENSFTFSKICEKILSIKTKAFLERDQPEEYDPGIT